MTFTLIAIPAARWTPRVGDGDPNINKISVMDSRLRGNDKEK